VWNAGYWASSYWGDGYWAKPGANPTFRTCGCSFYGDGTKYGDGELYCSSQFVHEALLVVKDVLCHYLSIRIQATGGFVLDSLRALIMRREVQPFNYHIDVDADEIHRMSFRIRGTGCLGLTSIRPIINIRNQQPTQ
jgi:hypothetical protein